MGMYDTVYFSCPACGGRIKDQSKSGDCLLRDISIDAVPADVVRGLDPKGYCPHCSREYQLIVQIIETVRVHVVRA